MPEINKILIIQTAFIGDAVLATGVAEKLHAFYPQAKIDFLLRKGNEGLLEGHPFLHVMIWNKKEGKYKNLIKLLRKIRSKRYDLVVNLQRFGASGFLTAFSGARQTVGFQKNPFSFLFSKAYPHHIGKRGDVNYQHETERNHALISELTDNKAAKPKLYPTAKDAAVAAPYMHRDYITISPASVWFTKQFPPHKWLELINHTPPRYTVYLLGGKGDIALCEDIAAKTQHPSVEVLAGKLSFLQTSALMAGARMNYTNDSAPMHFASAMNAPVTAVYCSTIPEFGFGPLSDHSLIWEERVNLECRPCGLHGHRACPLGHFLCAEKVVVVPADTPAQDKAF